MLDKLLKAIIVVAIISRTLLLLDNYGQNPDTQEYKGKKFTNFSTLVLAYIVTNLSKDGGGSISEITRAIIALSIATIIYTIFDQIWEKMTNTTITITTILVGVLSFICLYLFKEGITFNGDNNSLLPIVFVVLISLDYVF